MGHHYSRALSALDAAAASDWLETLESLHELCTYEVELHAPGSGGVVLQEDINAAIARAVHPLAIRLEAIEDNSYILESLGEEDFQILRDLSDLSDLSEGDHYSFPSDWELLTSGLAERTHRALTRLDSLMTKRK